MVHGTIYMDLCTLYCLNSKKAIEDDLQVDTVIYNNTVKRVFLTCDHFVVCVHITIRF